MDINPWGLVLMLIGGLCLISAIKSTNEALWNSI